MMHFLAGLPRSGSTVLAAILNQHPQVHVSPTSGLIDVMGAACAVWENDPAMAVQGRDKEELYRFLRHIIAAKYERVEKPVIIDKSRGWPAPKIMATMAAVLGQAPRIVATVRRVVDCAADFAVLAKPPDIPTFLRNSPLIGHLKSSYAELHDGFAAAPDNFLFVDYDDLLADPQGQLDRIHVFLGLTPFTHSLDAIDGAPVKELDAEVWGMSGLHDIGTKLERQYALDARKILGDLYESFDQPAFWKGEKVEDRPKQLIDLQLECATRGNFDEAWLIAQQLEKERAGDNRAAYNRGWYALRAGKLQEGHRLLDRGRIEGVFGNHTPQSPAPLWDGKTPGTILLNLEGGFGDQIHGVRWAKDIAARGNRVVIAGSGNLIKLLQDCPGVSAACAHEATGGVYHDAWVPSMSAVLALGYEYEHLSGGPYIRKSHTRLPAVGHGATCRVGLCWRGDTRFEHEHHKEFPVAPYFRAVRYPHIEYVSLQKDPKDGETPMWINTIPLNHWGETAEAIASCDLIISTCTAVAHLAGAMGVPTWIITPVLPYYLWALPGDTTPYYDSVRLFRQTIYGDWASPMGRIAGALAGFMLNRSRGMDKAVA